MPINPLGYSCIKKLQRDNLWHAYNEPINFYSVLRICISKSKGGQVGYSFPISLYPLQPFYNDPFSMPFFLFSSFTFDYCQNKGLFM